MINHRISADWSTTKLNALYSGRLRVQEVHTKAEVVHLSLVLLSLGILFNYHAYCKHMINSRISADLSTTKPIEAFFCTPHVQKVHAKAEVVHYTPLS